VAQGKLVLTPEEYAMLLALADVPAFAQTFLRILTKEKALIPFRFNKAQREFHRRRGQNNLILKARQLGMSTMVQAYIAHAVWTGPASAMIMAHDNDSTQMLRRIFARFYDHLPEDFRPERGRDSDLLTTFPLLESEVIIKTAGSGQTGGGRSGSYSIFHASEVAFWSYAEDLMAGAMQGGNPMLILESTPNGAQGYFYNLCMRALDGDRDWQFFFYPWWWDEGYVLPIDPDDPRHTAPLDDEEWELVNNHNLTPQQINWRRYKKRQLKDKFIQEYPEDPISCFLHSTDGFFGDISAAWTQAPYTALDPLGRRYVGGLDWGQASDYTVLSIVDRYARRQVDYWRINNQPYANMRQKVIATCKRWSVADLAVEANSMSSNVESLRTEMADEHPMTRIIPVTIDGFNKGPWLTGFADDLQEGAWQLIKDAIQQHEFVGYQSKQTASGHWVYSAQDDDHDDTVMANLLAWALATGALHARQPRVVQTTGLYDGRSRKPRRPNARSSVWRR
jgi:hypothetical protein